MGPEVETQALFCVRVPFSMGCARLKGGHAVRWGTCPVKYQGLSEQPAVARVKLSEFCSSLLTLSVSRCLQFVIKTCSCCRQLL